MLIFSVLQSKVIEWQVGLKKQVLTFVACRKNILPTKKKENQLRVKVWKKITQANEH
jgi:hypothetical protein